MTWYQNGVELFQSPTELSGHSDEYAPVVDAHNLFVSISYGAKWSFRLVEIIRQGDLHISFNLLRS